MKCAAASSGSRSRAITPALAESLGLSGTTGALVGDVEDGSPAAKAGVKRGDVITAINGERVKDSNVLRNEIAQLQPGTSVKVTVLRDGKEQVLDATLGALQPAGNTPAAEGRRRAEGAFGSQRRAADGRTALASSACDVSNGLVVADVEPGGRAASAGLRPGDVIEQVDRKPVTPARSCRAALNERQPAGAAAGASRGT